jgi:hypothetical protein
MKTTRPAIRKGRTNDSLVNLSGRNQKHTTYLYVYGAATPLRCFGLGYIIVIGEQLARKYVPL